MNLLKNKNVVLLLLIELTGSMIFYLPIGMMFKISRGLTISQIFLIESISFLVSIVLEVPSGWLSDKLGYKKSICLVGGFLLAARLLVIFSYSYVAFLAVSVLTGIGYALLTGCDTSLMYLSVDEKDTEKGFSLMSGYTNAGMLISLGVSSLLLLYYPMELTYWLTAIAAAVCFVLSFFLKDVPADAMEKEEKPNMVEAFKTFFANRMMIILVISNGLIFEIWRSVYYNLNQFQYERTGIDPKYFGIMFVILSVFPLLAGKTYAISAKFGQERLIKTLFAVTVAGLFALSLTDNAVVSVAVIAVIVAAYPLCQPALVDIQQKSIVGVNRATMMSIYALVMELGAAGENAITSAATGISLPFGFTALGVVGVIALILVFVYYRLANKSVTVPVPVALEQS